MRNDHGDIRKILITAEPDDSRRAEFTKASVLNKRLLDFGCGAGGYLKKISAFTSAAAGVELEKIMCDRLNSEGILCYNTLEEAERAGGKYDVITLFHVLEHLPDPVSVLTALAGMLLPGGKIVIEVPNADDALLSLYKSEKFADFTYWSCHLFLYSTKTLSQLIEKAGLHVNFIRQIQRYSLSNHMYWLSEGRPGGHQKWAFLSNPELDREYEMALADLGIADTIIAEITLK